MVSTNIQGPIVFGEGRGFVAHKRGDYKPGEFSRLVNVELNDRRLVSRRNITQYGDLVDIKNGQSRGPVGYFKDYTVYYNLNNDGSDAEQYAVNSSGDRIDLWSMSDLITEHYSDPNDFGVVTADVVYAFEYGVNFYWVVLVTNDDLPTQEIFFDLLSFPIDSLNNPLYAGVDELNLTHRCVEIPIEDIFGFYFVNAIMHKNKLWLATTSKIYYSKTGEPDIFDEGFGSMYLGLPNENINHISANQETVYIICQASIHAFTFQLDPGEDGVLQQISSSTGGQHSCIFRDTCFFINTEGLFAVQNNYVEKVYNTDFDLGDNDFTNQKLLSFENYIVVNKNYRRHIQGYEPPSVSDTSSITVLRRNRSLIDWDTYSDGDDLPDTFSNSFWVNGHGTAKFKTNAESQNASGLVIEWDLESRNGVGFPENDYRFKQCLLDPSEFFLTNAVTTAGGPLTFRAGQGESFHVSFRYKFVSDEVGAEFPVGGRAFVLVNQSGRSSDPSVGWLNTTKDVWHKANINFNSEGNNPGFLSFTAEYWQPDGSTMVYDFNGFKLLIDCVMVERNGNSSLPYFDYQTTDVPPIYYDHDSNGNGESIQYGLVRFSYYQYDRLVYPYNPSVSPVGNTLGFNTYFINMDNQATHVVDRRISGWINGSFISDGYISNVFFNPNTNQDHNSSALFLTLNNWPGEGVLSEGHQVAVMDTVRGERVFDHYFNDSTVIEDCPKYCVEVNNFVPDGNEYLVKKFRNVELMGLLPTHRFRVGLSVDNQKTYRTRSFVDPRLNTQNNTPRPHYPHRVGYNQRGRAFNLLLSTEFEDPPVTVENRNHALEVSDIRLLYGYTGRAPKFAGYSRDV